MRTADAEAFEAVRFLECRPEVPLPPEADVILRIDPARAGYRVIEDGRDVEERADIKAVVDYLHSRVLLHSLGDRASASVLHAASLRQGARRVLIAGAQGAGKTTLALRLIRSGYDFEGDEHVFIDRDGVMARPRACRVKESSLAFVPEAAAAIASAPSFVDEVGHRIFNVDPRTIGGSWRIEHGRAACAIVLEPNHGGQSSLRPIPALQLAQALVSEIGLREAGRRGAIQAVAALANATRAFALTLGDHEGALKCVNRALNEDL